MLLHSILASLASHASSHPIQALLALPPLTLLVYILLNELVRYRARLPGMKGPPGLPLIGNLHSIRTNAAAQYAAWAETYGDVYQVQMGNVPVVVVNSAKAVKALWVGQSQALGGRPATYTFHKIASSTAGLTIGTSPHDASLARRKKGVAVGLTRPAITSYTPHLHSETATFIADLLHHGGAGTQPLDPLPFIQRLSLSLAVTINWGVRIPSVADPLFGEIVAVEEALNRARSTAGNAQDYVPLLRLNPFSAQSARAREMRGRRDRYLHGFNSDLKAKVDAGTHRPCIQASVLVYKDEPLDATERTSISLSVLSGGFETISATVQWGVGYLALHPKMQERAYRAIGEFQGVGEGVRGLCDAGDELQCAYVAALAKETLRFFGVVPLSLPRETTQEVRYEGFVIPKGTTMYMNAWACNNDKDLWEDPHFFRPERWIETPRAPLFTLGLGYRMCSGHLLAMRELYLVYMRLFASFKLEPYGSPNMDLMTGQKNPRDLVLSPNKYKVYFVPRNEAGLRRELDETNKVKEDL